MATKPIGYYCDTKNALISDIAEHYGELLQNMNESDQAWLISEAAQHYLDTYCENPPSKEAIAVVMRMKELDQGQLGALIQALASK
jgi:hypothetical protein